jgi:hypothetical protein
MLGNQKERPIAEVTEDVDMVLVYSSLWAGGRGAVRVILYRL